ncbi:MAG: hypothetical protein OER90_01420 [Gemmatimonadota bacterium]|nr:hypothetical protein [Gemmatimonadota bacterium]
MPVTHYVDTERNILFVKRSGQTSPEEEEASFRARKEDPAITSGIPVFVDSREVDPPDASETIQRIAYNVAQNAARLECGRTAILVGSDVQYGMARMFMALTDLVHPHVEVFRDEGAALAWLAQPVSATADTPDV